MNFTGNSEKAGFTLVEMIVSLAIFSIVAVVALGALVKIISTNKKAQTLQASITNLNFAMETISREMRVGARYHCGYISGNTFNPNNSSSRLAASVCSSNSNLLAFESSKVDPTSPPNSPCRLVYAYRFSGSSGMYSLDKAEQARCGDSLVFGGDSSIIDPDVAITGYKLLVTATDANNPFPLVMVNVSGFAGIRERERERSYFTIQTAVSPRVP